MLEMYDPGARYRRRSAKRFVNILKLLFLVLLIGGVGFYFGRLQAVKEIHLLEEKHKSAVNDLEDITKEITDLRAEARTSNIRYEQLKTNYEEILPAGPIQDLTMLMKKQLDEGIDPKRMESVLRAVSPPQNCTEAQSKRFVVTTPAYAGPVSKVSIDKRNIVIYGSGESARNSGGDAEAWFDPTKPVEMTFELSSGKKEVKTGVLPIQYYVIYDDKEYRFTIAPGERSFARVTYDNCDAP